MGKGTWAAVAVGAAIGAVLSLDRRGRASLARRTQMLSTSAGPVEVEIAGEGPDLLILHGSAGGSDQGMWLAKVLDLTATHRVIAISRPGYLGTPDRVTLDEAVDLCVAALDALNVSRADVIGISGGGLTASTLAARHPGRVRSLVMLSAASGFVTEVGWRLGPYLAGTSFDVNTAFAAALPVPAKRALVGELLQSFAAPERRLRGTLRDVAISRTFSAPSGIAVPTLIVHGTADHAVPFAHAQRTYAGCSNGELVAIDGGGHLACLTHAEMGERVRAFLSTPRN